MLTPNLKLRLAVSFPSDPGHQRNFESDVNISLSRSRWATLYDGLGRDEDIRRVTFSVIIGETAAGRKWKERLLRVIFGEKAAVREMESSGIDALSLSLALTLHAPFARFSALTPSDTRKSRPRPKEFQICLRESWSSSLT